MKDPASFFALLGFLAIVVAGPAILRASGPYWPPMYGLLVLSAAGLVFIMHRRFFRD